MFRTLHLSDGAAVRVIEAGAGEPVLLIHGVGMRAEAWGPQITALAPTFRVIAVDMPGHGDSDPLAGTPLLEDYVAWAAQVVRTLGYGPVSIAGHSMGSLVAAGLAIERPDLVRRAALLNAVHRRSPEARAAVLARAAEIVAGVGGIDAPLARWFGPEQEVLKDQVAKWLGTVSPRGYASAYRAFAEGDVVYGDRIEDIICPLLVLTGDGDPNSTADMTRSIAAMAPNSRAVIIAGHRHMVNLTAQDLVNSELKHWLSTKEIGMTMTQITPDPRALREAFGCFMTGVTVVTNHDASGKPVGFTANSFSSVSMDPPLLQVSIANTSANLTSFIEGAGFAVNILSEGQKDISATFARPSEDRFANVCWWAGPVGSPLIAGVSAWFDCTLEQAIPAGDHTILLGRIGAFEAAQIPGLGYYRGAYVTPAATAAQMSAGPDVVISAILEWQGKVLLVDDGRGGITVPMARVGREGVQASLKRLIKDIGITAEPGSIYAVYEDTATGTQHIAIRCPAGPGAGIQRMFVDLSPAGMADVSDPALRQMLLRLAEESRIGNYGVYFGNHAQGRVQRLSEEQKQ